MLDVFVTDGTEVFANVSTPYTFPILEVIGPLAETAAEGILVDFPAGLATDVVPEREVVEGGNCEDEEGPGGL